MKSDGRDNTPNLVQIDTKKTQARQGGSIMHQSYRKTTMASNTENHQGSILTAVCFTDTWYLPMLVGSTEYTYNRVHMYQIARKQSQFSAQIVTISI